MGWKCAPQAMGLVRGEPKKGQKHRANAKAICAEAGEERHTSSETYDKDRSCYNVYSYEKSGFALHDMMIAEADAYRQKYRKRNGEIGERGLRKDAVIGYAVIFNPPGDVCKNWTDEEYEKFYEDSWEFMTMKFPNVFSDDNVCMVAEHKDEGMKTNKNLFTNHAHILGIPKNSDGRYCGNEIDAHMMTEINNNYPKFMRERGWDMDDLDVTDWDKWKEDEEYRNSRKEKGGKTVNEYIYDVLEAQLQEANSLVDELSAKLDDVSKYETEKEIEFQKKEDALESLKRDLKQEIELFRKAKEYSDISKGEYEKARECAEEQFSKYDISKMRKMVLESSKTALEGIVAKNGVTLWDKVGRRVEEAINARFGYTNVSYPVRMKRNEIDMAVSYADEIDSVVTKYEGRADRDDDSYGL